MFKEVSKEVHHVINKLSVDHIDITERSHASQGSKRSLLCNSKPINSKHEIKMITLNIKQLIA